MPTNGGVHERGNSNAELFFYQLGERIRVQLRISEIKGTTHRAWPCFSMPA